ncbi:uncharacterized protein LOC131674187 isoform X2 [Phymastichus coffea]|uniref:uncharacterized protein LOC131674187 isoform X2 n=1 Tax=Phymastichus coffea TaxID=108790 RepID=UPI00273B6AD4|nr:uncharacterized protein LOC131674187 isoform X2 [Phymastichus coffea]
MAGALSESAPRPVSVVRVDGEAASSEQQQQQQQPPPPPPPPLASAGHDQVTVVSTCGGGDAVAATTTLPARSFASTEAQTEQLSPQMLLGPQALSSHAELLSEELRDARRRERRMRRQHRRAMQRASGAAAAAAAAAAVNGACAAAGVPPTYPGLLAAAGHAAVPPSAAAAHSGFLHPPPAHLGLRGLSLGLPFPVPASVSAFGRDAVPKQCCGLGSPPVRWSILGVGVVGLVCAGAGALLGALRATGRDHIAVALLMIGIGVVLVTVSAVAWRVTSRENCSGFFGLTGRIPAARPMHPYAAMIYPEFQFRTPPPSYQASMQEYRLRLLLLDRLQPTSSPPPTYRSNAGSLVANGLGAMNGTTPAITGPHHASHHHHSMVGTVGRNGESRPPSYCGHRVVAPTTQTTHHGLPPTSKKDANLVRIVQTESEPVILSGDQTPPCAAVEVLAHL